MRDTCFLRLNEMYNKFAFSKNKVFIFFVISIIVRFVFVYNSGIEQISDFNSYLSLSRACLSNHLWYPNVNNLYDSYIWAPGFINYLIGLLHLFDSIKFIQFVNVSLTVILDLELYWLTKKYISHRTALIVLTLLCVYPTNYGISYWLISDLLFVVLFFTILVIISWKRWYFILLAGVFTAYANWVRPFLPVLVVSAILLIMINSKSGIWKKQVVLFVATSAFTIFLIAFFTYNRMGVVNFQSSTSGINLIMGANEKATGAYMDCTIPGEVGYIENTDKVLYYVKDAIWKERAIEYILNHPIKWISLVPNKLFYMYSNDSFAMGPFWEDHSVSLSARDIIISIRNDFPRLSLSQYIYIFNQVVYYFVLFFSVLGLATVFKSRNKFLIMLYIYIIMGTGMTIITVGGNRYHYILMPAVFITAAYSLNYILNSKYKLL